VIYLLHGIFETSERYVELASRFHNAVAIQIQDYSSIRNAATATAPRLQFADVVIAYGCGGLVLYDILQLQLIPPPKYVVFVSVPFLGVNKTKDNLLIFNALKIKLNILTAKALSYKLTFEPDEATTRGIYSTVGPHLKAAYAEVFNYHTVLTPLPRSKTFICLGGRDTDLKKYTFPYAKEIVFEDCGKNIIKDAQQEFVQFLTKIGDYQW
jgi:hypothetical protein